MKKLTWEVYDQIDRFTSYANGLTILEACEIFPNVSLKQMRGCFAELLGRNMIFQYRFRKNKGEDHCAWKTVGPDKWEWFEADAIRSHFAVTGR